MKRKLLIALLLLPMLAQAQYQKKRVYFPPFGAYQVLKGDFHIHTVFSDGQVWPTTRVTEAYEDDLDAICISDHTEYMPYAQTDDYNSPYEMAKKEGDKYGLIVIRGTEITRRSPVGHINCIFMKDLNPLKEFVNMKDPEGGEAGQGGLKALDEAVRQGAFTEWNHPDYPFDETVKWHPLQDSLQKSGKLMGLEVVNTDEYYPDCFRWCLEKNMVIMANTDMHHSGHYHRQKVGYRAMTLVLSKERTEEGIREAIFDRRTIAHWDNKLAGREQHVRPLVEASLKARFRPSTNGTQGAIELVNLSSMPFEIEPISASEGVGKPRKCVVQPFGISGNASSFNPPAGSNPVVRVKIKNVLINVDTYLEIDIPVEKL